MLNKYTLPTEYYLPCCLFCTRTPSPSLIFLPGPKCVDRYTLWTVNILKSICLLLKPLPISLYLSLKFRKFIWENVEPEIPKVQLEKHIAGRPEIPKAVHKCNFILRYLISSSTIYKHCTWKRPDTKQTTRPVIFCW
jgi:hypothetical protein